MMKKTLALAITVGLVSGCASFDRNSGLVVGAVVGGAAKVGGTVPGGAVVGGIIGAALGTLAEKSREPVAVAAAPVAPPAAEPAPEAAPAPVVDDSYTVVRGDNLWNISGKESIYGNPYQWPLIYKANRDKIRDADLIYPDQVLTIKRDSSQSDIDAAVAHARGRGAWAVGSVEAVDTDYLNQ